MLWVQLVFGCFVGFGFGQADADGHMSAAEPAAIEESVNTIIVHPPHDTTLVAGEVLHAVAQARGEGAAMASFTWTVANVMVGVSATYSGQEVDIPFPEQGHFLLQCVARVSGVNFDLTPAFRHITVVAPNQPPETTIVVPSSDVTIEVGSTIHFEASGTDADGDALTFHWRKANQEGPSVGQTLIGPAVDFDFPEEGMWRVTCTAVDVHGDADPTPAWVDVQVTASNLPPDTVIVSPTEDVVIFAGEQVLFEGMAVNGNLTGTTVNWQVTGGLVARYYRGEQVTIPFQRAGRFEVYCSAKNAAGQSDPTPDSRTVTVRQAQTVVETEIVFPENDVVVPAGTRVAFEAQGLPENAAFEWEISRRGALAGSRYASGPNIEVDFANIGVFEVACTAVTMTGQRDPTPARRFVSVVNLQATIVQPSGRALTVPVGIEIPFEGRVVSPASQSPTPFWYLYHAPEERFSGTSTRLVFPETGTFSVIFEVRDDLGNVARDHRIVHVSEAGALGVNILDPIDGAVFSVDELLHLDGELFGSDEITPEITWNVAGQAFSSLEVRDVMVKRPGRYNVTLVAAVPERRLYATDQVMIEIFDPKRVVRAEISEPLTDLTILPGDTVFFDGKQRNLISETDFGPYWRIIDAETEEVLLEARRQTLGRVTFPETEADYIVSYALVGPSMEGPADLRRIRVAETRPENFSDNDTPERAAAIEPGRYRNLRLNRPNYFELNLQRPSSTLKFDVEFAGTAQFSVFRKDDQLEWTPIYQGSVSDSGGFQVTRLAPGDHLIRLAASEAKHKSDLEFGIGVSVLQPALFLPDIQENGMFGTSIGLVNPNAELIEVDLTALDADGSILEKVGADLGAYSRLHIPLSSLFGQSATQVAWVRVDSSHRLVGYSMTTSHDKSQCYAMTGAEKLSAELFVPHIAQQTQQWYSRASVVNGSSEISESMLLTQAEDRDLLVDQSFSQDSFDFLEKFGGTLPQDAQWGICAEENKALYLAGSEVFGKNDGNHQVAGLILDDVQQNNPNFLYVSRNIYFTHIARDVAQFWTGLALVNVSDQLQAARLVAYGTQGTHIGTLDLQLEPGEKKVDLAEILLGDLGSPEDVDWVVLEADETVVGYELFGSHDNKRLAGLEAGTALSRCLSFPIIDPSGASWHGLAVVNVHDTPAEANFTLFDDVGTALATQSMILDPHEKVAMTMTQLFGFLPATAGWVLCESDQPLTGFELVGDHTGDTLSAVSAL